MEILDPSKIVAIFDDENNATSTVVCRLPAGLDRKGKPAFRLVKQTVSRREADSLAMVLLKKDKDADDLRGGKKPGPSKKLIQSSR